MPWSQVALVNGNHPVVYSGQGDHASYHRVGVFTHSGGAGRDHTADGGRVWRTNEALYDVTTRPWYGYGGAWGEVGNIGSTTGPSGPKFQPLEPATAFNPERACR